MQRRYPFLISLLFVVSTSLVITASSSHPTSKTYFYVRPQFQFGSPEQLTFTRDLKSRRSDGYKFGLRATLFGGQSTNEKNLGRYFMPFGSECAFVDGTIKENGTDLLPQNFNIFSTKYSDEVAMFLPNNTPNVDPAFRSKISLSPRQSVIGLGLGYQQEFTICDYNLWFWASAPIVHVKNSMGFCESIIETGTFYTVEPISGESTNLDKSFTNMTDALAQDNWCFGKIGCKNRTKTGIPFVELVLGVQWLNGKKCTLDSYIGVTIPTGNKPKAKYVFEPVVGNGGHAGIIWGNAIGIHLCHNETHNIDIKLATNMTTQYLFKRKQKRSMDLKYKPWSRYIELYKDKAQATQAHALRTTNIQSFFLATPGINILTQDVEVKPGFNISLNTAFIMTQNQDTRGFTGEIGYNFYAKEAEEVCLECSNLGTAAIKDHSGRGIVNPARNITNDLLTNEASVANISFHGINIDNVLDQYDGRVLTNCDLDLDSAAHPCILSYTIYAALGYHWDDINYPITTGIGGSYEFDGHMNTALNRWLLWGTLGVSF